MHFKYGFGKGYKEFDIDESNIMTELRQNEVNTGLSGIEEVKYAMNNPIGSKRLSEIVKPGEKTVIITSDITRPMPGKTVLPVVIEELNAAGLKNEDITIVFALGNHRKQSEDEKKYLAGEDIYNKIKCIDSDTGDCIRLGITSRGTPVDIFSRVAKAERRICLGNIEYHYFAGYSGGAKAIMPGVSTRAAIQANHSGMVRDEARAGAIEAVHFYSYPYTSERAKEKVIELTRLLARYTYKMTLHIVSFTDIQLEINDKCPQDQITIIMRRAMMSISEKIAGKTGAQALITGESMGQVASQTMQSLSVTNAIVKIPVFRPLIGMDKNEIIEIARKIETFETSILPYEDCCTVFVAKHPKTRPKLDEIEKYEAGLQLEELISKAVENTEVLVVTQG